MSTLPLVWSTASHGTPIYLIDPKEVPGSDHFVHIQMGASAGMRRFIEMLEQS